MESIDDLLKKLERYEEDSANNFDEGMAVGGLHTRRGQNDAVKKLLRIEHNASPYEIENWGIYVKGVPLPWQLTIQPTLIVDVSPMSRDDFIKTYGVTPEQFATLAENSFVIPNLLEYESDKKRGFTKHKTYDEVLRPILYNEFSRCRINAIRRNRFFELFGVEEFENYKKEGMELFRKGLSACSDDTREELTNDRDIEGALIAIANNWAYIIALGSSYPQIDEGIKRIRFRFDPEFSTPNPQIMRAEVDFVKVCKHLVATPYTATFGGTHNMSVGGFNRLSRYLGSRRIFSNRDAEHIRQLGDAEQALMELLTNVGLKRYTIGTSITDYDLPIPVFSDDVDSVREFKNFISFLTDIRERLIKTDIMLDDIYKVSGEMNERVRSWTDIMEIYESIRQEKKRLNSAGRAASAAVTGGAAAVYIDILSRTKMNRRTLLALLGGGAIGWTILGNEISEVFQSQLSENKMRILDDFNNLIKWQVENR